MHKIPVTVITGFLGSGKTTAIRHLLQNNQGRR
ncbi:MAG: GTP-binding protein, partial [Microcoleus sp.]